LNDAGVADRRIQASESPLGGIHDRRSALRYGQVRDVSDDRRVCGAQLRRRFFELLFRDIDQ
jgi:hypothetical protein